MYVYPSAIETSCTECRKVVSLTLRIKMKQCDVRLCDSCEATLRTMLGRPASPDGGPAK